MNPGLGDADMDSFLRILFPGGIRQFKLYAVALLLLAWRPIFLESETLKMTTYYPAPYGGYVNLLTTGDTYLAKSDSASVYWGNYKSRLTTDQGGSIELGGNGGMPYIDFKYNSSVDYHNRIIMSNLDGRLIIMGDLQLGTEAGYTTVNGKKVGYLRNACEIRPYYNGTKTYCGGNQTESGKYTIVSLQTIDTTDSYFFFGGSSDGGYNFIKRSGAMICCKFETMKI